jgi:AraC family ethanolamine operon transcriptional activator
MHVPTPPRPVGTTWTSFVAAALSETTAAELSRARSLAYAEMMREGRLSGYAVSARSAEPTTLAVAAAAGVRRVEIDSIEDLREAISGADVEARQFGTGAVTGTLCHAALAGIDLTVGNLRGTVELRGPLSDHRLSLGVLLAAGAPSRQWLREIALGDVGVFPSNREHHAHYREHAHYAAFTVEPTVLLARLADEGLRIDERVLRRPGMVGRGPRAWAVGRRVAAMVEHDAAALSAGDVRRELAARLLLAYGHDLAVLGRGEVPPPPPLRTPTRIVRDVLAFVDEQSDRPVTVEELCDRFGLARRSLHRAFVDVLGVPPASYVRLARLNGVRRDLVRRRGDATTTVTAVARTWGFGEFGRFAAQYRRLFGEAPSATLAKR